jgi:hypothetical protein
LSLYPPGRRVFLIKNPAISRIHIYKLSTKN